MKCRLENKSLSNFSEENSRAITKLSLHFTEQCEKIQGIFTNRSLQYKIIELILFPRIREETLRNVEAIICGSAFQRENEKLYVNLEL